MSTPEKITSFTDGILNEPTPSEKNSALRELFERFPVDNVADYFHVAQDNNPSPLNDTKYKIIRSDGESLVLGTMDQSEPANQHTNKLIQETVRLKRSATERRAGRSEYKEIVLGGFNEKIMATHLTKSCKLMVKEEAELIYNSGLRNSERGIAFARKLDLTDPQSGGANDPLRAQEIDDSYYRKKMKELLKRFASEDLPTEAVVYPSIMQIRRELAEWETEHFQQFGVTLL